MISLRSLRLILFAGIIIYLPAEVRAGSPDNQLWPSVVLVKEVKAGTKVEIEQQLRLRNQTPLFSQTFSELRFSYPVSNILGATLYYRQIFYTDKTAYRVAVSTQARSLPGVKGLSVRVKLQCQQSREDKPAYHARFRGTINLLSPNRAITLFLQGEPWLLLGDQQSWTRYRLDVGIKYQLSKGLSGNVFYRFQGDHRESGWSGINILGLTLNTVL